MLRLPVLQGLLDGKTDVSIPALKLGAVNQLRFNFQYMNPMPGGSVENCITFQPVQNHVVIGDDSTIDFSKYYHFIAMPDLRAFANASFPFSRMADLSESIVVMPKAANEGQVATLLDTMGTVGAQTGLPAINVTVTDDGSQIQNKDADIMVIGNIPDKLKDEEARRSAGAGGSVVGQHAAASDRVPEHHAGQRRSSGQYQDDRKLNGSDGRDCRLPVAV